MKEKISLMLVLGIVGVLVISFVADSRVSAGYMIDVEVCELAGYGCEVVGTLELDYDIVDTYTGMADEWRMEDVDWDSGDLGQFFGAYDSRMDNNSGAQYFSGFDFGANISFGSGFDMSALDGKSMNFDMGMTVTPSGVSTSGAVRMQWHSGELQDLSLEAIGPNCTIRTNLDPGWIR